tara:strand:+ start:39 stop:317 length:279 start_codon:yes stop_codon:yes gene_type:complete
LGFYSPRYSVDPRRTFIDEKEVNSTPADKAWENIFLLILMPSLKQTITKVNSMINKFEQGLKLQALAIKAYKLGKNRQGKIYETQAKKLLKN